MPYTTLQIAVAPPFSAAEAEQAVKQLVEKVRDISTTSIEQRCRDLLLNGKQVPFDFFGHDWQGFCRWAAAFRPERKVTIQFIGTDWDCYFADRFCLQGGVQVASDRVAFLDEDLEFPERWQWNKSILGFPDTFAIVPETTSFWIKKDDNASGLETSSVEHGK